MVKPTMKYAVNDRILCFHGLMLYEAKILETRIEDGVPNFFVHYQGWNNRWDEWVTDDRLLEHNDENLKQQQELTNKHAGTPAGKIGGGGGQRGRPALGGGDGGSTAPKTKTPATGGKSKTNAGSSSGPSTPFDGSTRTSTNAAAADGGLELESRASTPSVDGAASVTSASNSTTGGPLSASQSGSTKRKAGGKQKGGAVASTPANESQQAPSADVGDTPASGEPKRKRGRQSAAATPQAAAMLPPSGGTPAVQATGMNPETGVESFEQYRGRQEIQVKIPDELRSLLVDDWNSIGQHSKLYKTPAPKTVDDILSDYIEHKKGQKISSLKLSQATETAEGIREYFNVMLGIQLLYKFERPQYKEILAQYQSQDGSEGGASADGAGPSTKRAAPRMSSIYGCPHLLRLFVRLGQMLAYTDFDQKNMDMIMSWLHDFLKYLSKNRATFFRHEDYETAPPEYQRKAYAN